MTVPPQQPPGWQPPAGWQPPGWQPPGQPQPPAGWQSPGQPPGPGQQAQWQGPPAQWQVPPTVGWPPPQPAPVTKRIPDDLPFVVRQRVGKRALLFGGVVLFLALLLACPIGLASHDSAGIVPLIAVFGCVLVFFGALFGLQLYLITSGGPVLAVGPAGLWIKTRPTRGQAIWLPWEGIERIYRRRWSFEKMVCVKARDPRVGNNLGAFTALDSSMQQLFFGSGFTATVNFADKPEQEIMAALVHFGAGRCPIS